METEQITQFTSHWTQAQPSLAAFVSASITKFSDAEDVLQKIAAVAIEKYSDYDAARPFLPWAIGIARFEILRYWRDQSTERHRFVAEVIPSVASAFEELKPELDGRREALAQCLKTVQGRSREVLEKRYGEGIKTGNIATDMGLSPGNVSVILNRAYQQLRTCIERRIRGESA